MMHDATKRDTEKSKQETNKRYFRRAYMEGFCYVATLNTLELVHLFTVEGMVHDLQV